MEHGESPAPAALGRGKLSEALNVLLPQRIVGSDAICCGIEYHIACLADTPNLPLRELIALPIEIQILTNRGQLRSVCGIFTEARVDDFDGGLAVYHLVVRGALAVMEKRTNSRIFRCQNEIEIARTLCDGWRHSNSVLAGAFELDPHGPVPATRADHAVQRERCGVRAARTQQRGIAWYFKSGRRRTLAVDRARDRTAAHTLVLFEDATSLRQNAAGTVRYHREDAVAELEVITSWVGKRELQPGRVTRHSW